MIIAIDTETTGTDFNHGCKAFMVTACTGKENHYWHGEVDPYDRSKVYWDKEVLLDIVDCILSADKIIMHNAKFDVRSLNSIDIKVPFDNIEDTLIASHVMCSGEPHGLKELALKYLDYHNDNEIALDAAVKAARTVHSNFDIAKKGHKCFPGLQGAGTRWHKMDMWLCMEECIKYACDDVEMTWLLWQMYEDCIDHYSLQEQYETRKALLPITYQMEETGLHFYQNIIQEEIETYTTLQEQCRCDIQDEIRLAHRLDLTKEKHVRFLFFNALDLPVYKTSDKTGVASLNKEAVEHYIKSDPDNKSLQLFSDWRKAGTKIGYLTSYQRHMCDDSRIRSNILITGTRETRQATLSPNIQNIDKGLRHIMGPPPGKIWLDYDLVNIELRIWTYEVGNTEMIETFEKGGSVHLLIAGIIHPELIEECLNEGQEFNEVYKGTWYQWVKNGNFAIIYGANPRTADRSYKKEGAYSLVASRFPEVQDYTAKVLREAEYNYEVNNASYVTCIGGYQLDVDIEKPHTAPNYKIQGSAGYIINHAMINVVNNPFYQDSSCEIVNQVHDSIVIELDEEDNTIILQQSIKESIEAAGLRYLPTCEASFDVIKNTEAPF